MSQRSSEEHDADQLAGCLLGLVFLLIGGFLQALKELLSPTPTGIQVGHKWTPMGAGRSVGIPVEDRCKHAHVLGPTGSGKTTALKNLILQDMAAGHGLAVIDPKGDLVQELLRYAPAERFDDIIYFDPTDSAYPLGFNILEAVEEPYRSRTASEVVAIFKKLFAESWGPRLEYILRAAILTLLEVPGATLLEIPTLLLDAEYRAAIVPHLSNFAVRAFWDYEFGSLSNAQRMQAVMPILNKVGPWLVYPEVRNIVGQVHSSFRLREVMDQRKNLLVPIPQGILGEDASALIGAMLVSKIQLEAMTRAGLPNHLKTPFFLYVDEFQNFVTSAFEKILTEARSFGLGLIVANQYSEQLSRDLALALEKNVAVRLSCYFENGTHRILYQTLQDPQAAELIIQPLPPPTGGSSDLPKQICHYSRQRYGRPRQDVEHAILERRARPPLHEQTIHGHQPALRPLPGNPAVLTPAPYRHDDFWQ